MESRRDDVEALASVAGLLLEPGEPGELADRFLARVLELFGGEAALFCVPGVDGGHVSAIGLTEEEAERLAEELGGGAESGGSEPGGAVQAGVVQPAAEVQPANGTGPAAARALAARGPWAQVLVAASGSEATPRAVLALFSTRP